jgi:hypothetical protein
MIEVHNFMLTFTVNKLECFYYQHFLNLIVIEVVMVFVNQMLLYLKLTFFKI